MRVLAFDPSGNWGNEGMGTTGWSLFEDGTLVRLGIIQAKEFTGEAYYWDYHVRLIESVHPEVVVYETYALQAGKAAQQSWSHLQTPQLIGLLKWFCMINGIECVGQSPALVKGRFSDDVLVNLGIAERRGSFIYIKDKKTNPHMRDSVRHGLWHLRYGAKKEAHSGK